MSVRYWVLIFICFLLFVIALSIFDLKENGTEVSFLIPVWWSMEIEKYLKRYEFPPTIGQRKYQQTWAYILGFFSLEDIILL